jgi:RNA polymerase sigma-70 factor (ECF subfamily)
MKQHMAKRKDFEAQALFQLDDLYGTALHMLGNESEAQALVQDSIVQAYDFWHKCPSGANSRIWLFKIMAEAITNKYQPFPGFPSPTISSNDNEGFSVHSWSPSQQPISDSSQVIFPVISPDDVTNAIGDLPNDIRLIVILALLEAFTYRDIANITNLDLETVKTKLRDGRDRIRKGLFQRLPFEDIDDVKDIPANMVKKSSTG